MNDSLKNEFRQSLIECRELYRAAGEECVHSHPHLLKQPAAEFLKLMEDLHRGLLIKVFVIMVRADWRWSPEERELARDFVRHLWDKRLQGSQLRKAFKHLLEQEELLTWKSLLRPFKRFPSLRDHAGEIETTIVRLANIVAKSDGDLHDKETDQLRAIQRELEKRLYVEVEDRTAEDINLRRSSEEPFGASEVSMADEDEESDGDGVIPLQAVNEPGVKAAPAPVQQQTELSREEKLEQALDELERLIGLRSIKHEINELTNFLKVQEARAKHNLPRTEVSLHMVFAGNPGTGKTTVARIVGRILGALGLLEKGHLVETDRSGLVAQYAGQTGPRTNKRIDEALDGVLFIDEAYSLSAERGDDPYGGEAVQAILKRMEDERQRLVVVIAGYPEPMQRLLHSNPGLSSRFGRRLDFPDYTTVELAKIFAVMCETNHYVLPALTRAKLLLGFQYALDERDEHFGNGRLARNVFEAAIRRLANRIVSISPITQELLTTLQAEDIHFAGAPSEYWDELDLPSERFVTDCPQCDTASLFDQSSLGASITCGECKAEFIAEWGEPAIEV